MVVRALGGIAFSQAFKGAGYITRAISDSAFSYKALLEESSMQPQLSLDHKQATEQKGVH